MGLWLDRGRECDNLHQAIEIQIIQYLCGTDSPVSVALNTPLDRPIDRALRGFFIRFCYPSVTRPPKWRLLVTNKPIYHSELQPILERSNRFCIGNDVTEIRSNNKKMNSVFGVEIPHPSSTYIDEEEKNVLLKGRDLLVGSNNIATKPIFVKPVYPTEKITVHWKLLADEFNQTGSFDVPVSYDIREKHENRYVDTPDELQNDIETICDYIESIT